MASYNELNALIDAYINRNGVQAITGQILNGVLKAMVEQLGRGYTIMGAATPTTDPGTPDGPESYFASTPGTYTDFDGLQVVPGELALLCYTPSDGWSKETIYEGFQQVTAQADDNIGVPSVGVSYSNGVLSFNFRNIKGEPGENGQDGDPAGFGQIGADITGGVGTPAVSVESSGPATAKNLQFHFTNLKGETGVTSVVATVDNTTGTPACTVSLVGQQLTLAFTGLKGAQGNTGSSVDYPYELVNNCTTDDATKGLAASQGVALQAEVSQLEAELYNSTPTETDITSGSSNFNGLARISTEKYESSTSVAVWIKYIPVEAGKQYKIKTLPYNVPINTAWMGVMFSEQAPANNGAATSIKNYTSTPATVDETYTPATNGYIGVGIHGSSAYLDRIKFFEIGVTKTLKTDDIENEIDGLDGRLDDVEGDVSQLCQKLIKLTGLGATGVAAGVTAIGDVYYNTSSKLLWKLVSGTPTNGVYDAVPYYDGAIYTCGEKFYIWNGVELLESASDRILNDYNIFPLCGFDIDAARGGVTKAGDVYYNTTTNLLRRCVSYTNPYTGTYETVNYDSNTLYLNLSDNCLYQHNGGTMALLQDTSFYKSNRIIHLNNIGSGWNTNTQVVRLGEVYFNSETKKLLMAASKNSYGEVLNVVDVPLSYDALYIFNGAFYKWNGENLVVVPLANATFSASSSVLMYPGVSSGNGNIWSLVMASLPSEIGDKYGNGFFSLELVEVSVGDVLEINYTKMGIDRAKYKIGIIEYDENGKYFGIDGAGYNSELTYYQQDSLVSFQERTKYIRFSVYRLDTSNYELQTEFRMPIFFTKYSSNLVKLVKDFVSNGSNITPSFPYVKGITYPVENTNVVFNNTASLSYKDKSIGFNNGYVIFPEEYTPHGKGFPLILYIHGTEGISFVNATSPTYLDILKNVAKGGYIVADCSALSSFYYNNDEGTTKTIVDANYPEPIAWECYHKLFLYLTRRWNIDESRVYVFGKSAGGLNTIMLSQMGLLPIKAAANLAGSIDVITNMRVMASGANNINPFLHRIGLTDASLGNYIGGSGDADYLVSHIQELAGFNPLWFKTVGLEKETQIRRCIADGLNTSAIENDITLQNAVSAASTSLRIPIKWWQAIDDVNVPIGTTRMYQKMVRNGGGVFEIREFPAGCGAHHAVDNAPNAPTTSYTHRNGVTVTIPVAYAEVLDWFNLWW